MALDYLLTFTTQPSGHTIDFVDVGMPNGNFDFNSIQANINGNPLSISKDYQGTGGEGFAVEMGPYAILPGQTGTIHVSVGHISQVLYKDEQDENYASAVFAPLYFQSNVITGNTDITVIYHLPPLVNPEEPRWHSAPTGFPSEPATAFDSQGRITYTHGATPAQTGKHNTNLAPHSPKVMSPQTALLQKRFRNVSSDTIFILCIGFGFIFLGIPLLTMIAGNRRKLQYMTPRISIEGTD